MEQIIKIELPLVKFDTNRNKKQTTVYIDIESVRGMMLRDWEEGGMKVPDLCVLSKGLKTKRLNSSNTTTISIEDVEDNYLIIGMSKERLMDKLAKTDFVTLIS